MESLLYKKAGNLSGGQKQRLALVSALANRPKVLMLDEPFSALDEITRRNIQNFFVEHVKPKVTSIFVTHNIDEALTVGDDIRVGIGPNADEYTSDTGKRKKKQFEINDLNLNAAILDSLKHT